MAAISRALTRSSRDRPEPFSITRCEAVMPLRASHWRIARCAAWPSLASALVRFCAPMERNSCCAMVLLLYLLMSRMISTTSGEKAFATSVAFFGTLPWRSLPAMLPPSSCQMPRTAPAVKLGWSSSDM
ncbi:hypothetical protein D3C76_1109120 [compost metagenome]